jgi:hypothetical protein
MATQSFPFEPLPMAQKHLVPVSPNQYRILARGGDTKQVEASSAYEAFRLSGIEDAIRIERIANIPVPLLKQSDFRAEPEALPEALAEELANPLHSIFRKKDNPILSAHDMDSLMQKLQQFQGTLSAEGEETATLTVPFSDIKPQPGTPISTAIGIEVKGDGFDEIIPSRPAVAAPPVQAEIAAPPVMEAPSAEPEQNLSAEEIDALLNGKP